MGKLQRLLLVPCLPTVDPLKRFLSMALQISQGSFLITRLSFRLIFAIERHFPFK